MDKNMIPFLEQLGLSAHEASFYIAGLSTGAAKIAEIARIASIKRTTAYTIAESLIQKGLMRKTIQGLTTLYQSESPEKLEILVETQRQQLQKALPELQKLYRDEQNIELIGSVTGMKAIKNLYEELLRDMQWQTPYWVISHQETWARWDETFFKTFEERRAEKGRLFKNDIRLLLINSPEARKQKTYEKNLYAQVRYLQDTTTIASNIVITDQKIIMHEISTKPTALILQTKSIIETNKTLFEALWKTAQT